MKFFKAIEDKFKALEDKIDSMQQEREEKIRIQKELEIKQEQEVTSYLQTSMKNVFLLCPHPMRMYLMYYKLLLTEHNFIFEQDEINNDDIAKVFRRIVMDAQCPKTFSAIDKNYSSKQKKEVYFHFFNQLCNRGDVKDVYRKEKLDIRDSLNTFHDNYSEDENDSLFFFLSMKDTNFVSDEMYERIKKLNSDVRNFKQSLAYLFFQTRTLHDILDYCTTLLHILVVPNYIVKILENEEFEKVITNYIELYDVDFLKADSRLYDVYLEYYADVFGEKLSEYDFYLVLYFYQNSVTLRNYLTGAENILAMMGIDYLDITNRYAESTYEDIYSYTASILSEPQFELLLACDESKDLITALEMVLAYESIDKVEFERWLSTVWKMGAIEDKSEIYRIKNKLLSIDSPKIEKMKNLKNIYASVSNGEDFELFLKQLYEMMGYIVEMTPTTGDQGADLILEKDGLRIAVQAKHYSGSVGNKAIQEVVASLKYYNADKAIVATNSEFTKSAIALALANDVELMEGKDILRLITNTSIG